MTARRATLGDLGDLVRMGMSFAQAAGMPPATEAGVADFLTSLIGNPAGAVFRTDGGFLAALLAPLYYRPDYVQAHEIAWWSEDGRGLSLLRAYEDWASEMGAHEILMSSLRGHTGETVARLMERKGYRPRDISYVKGV